MAQNNDSTDMADIKFVIGSRRLFSLRKSVTTLSYTLDRLIAGEILDLVPLDRASQGYRIESAPPAALQVYQQRAGDLMPCQLRSYTHYYVDMDASFAEYMDAMSSKTRSTIQRKSRKFEKFTGQPLDIRCYRQRDEIRAFLEMARPLSRLTYQHKFLNAGLPEDDSWTRAAFELADRGALYAFLLFHDGQPVSYLCLPVEQGVVRYDYVGYHPDYGRHSVGTILQLSALETLFADSQCRYFDFTQGEGQHKAVFSNNSIEALSFLLMRRSVGNRLTFGAQGVFDTSVETAGRIAEKTGLKTRLRKMLKQ